MIRSAFSLALVVLAACLGSFGLASAADAQQPASQRQIVFVGMVLDVQSKEADAFRQALRDAGYIEGRDIAIDWWVGDGNYHQVSKAVADAVLRKVDVIVVEGTPVALAAKRSTSTIPIVMALVADPLGSGLVASLARPGGNVTGLSSMAVELTTKRLQLLKEALPTAARIGVMFNPDAPYNAKAISLLKSAAPELKVELTFVGVRRGDEFRSAFSAVKRSKAEGLMVLDDAFMAAHEETILRLASKARLAVVYGYKTRAGQGALISYAPDFRDLFRQSAGYVDKILKGAKPGDLPIEQPTKFELVVNLKTAKALGLKIPDSLLVQATEVIK